MISKVDFNKNEKYSFFPLYFQMTFFQTKNRT